MEIGWIVFAIAVFVSLFLDLFVFHRNPHKVSLKEALLLSFFWIGLGLGFGVYVFLSKGNTAGIEYLTGYLLEKSLSIDNIFVFVLIFSYFQVPEELKHKVLFYGVLGAIVFRGIFIFAGLELVQKFHWITYIFGIILIISAVKLLTTEEKKFEPEKSIVMKITKKFFKVSNDYDGDKFFTKIDQKTYITPLFLALIFVELSDIMFAIDSVPAILAISKDQFVVYTSNIFAILGLRSLYFATSGVLSLFRYLHYGLSFILGFIGLKMLMAGFYKIPVLVSLSVIVSAVIVSILASLVVGKDRKS